MNRTDAPRSRRVLSTWPGRHRVLTGVIAAALAVALTGVAVVALGWRPPTAAAPVLTGVTAGAQHTCALTAEGDAYCWGRNRSGELGRDTPAAITPTPVAVDTSGLPSGTTFVAVSAGGDHTCALGTTGQPYCWGGNERGQLGDGTTTSSSTPVPVDVAGLPAGTAVVAVEAGQLHTCALTDVSVVYCWGYNNGGELGDGTTTDRSTPAPVAPGDLPADATISSLAVGGFHSCVLTSTGVPYCWGGNRFGQVGDGTRTDRTAPVAVDTGGLAGEPTVVGLAGGLFHTCGVTSDGVVSCWGDDQYGQLGDGEGDPGAPPPDGDAAVPRPVAVATEDLPPDVTFTTLAAGGASTCALTSDGDAYCWGDNGWGQLGDGTEDDAAAPVAVSGRGLPWGTTWAAVSVGGYHTCAVPTAGETSCWGSSDVGQLGGGSTADRSRPGAVRPPG